MSVVCAKIYEDRIEVAADSIIVQGWSKETKGEFSKLVKINDMIIGATGNCDELSLLLHFAKTHKPETPSERDLLSFIAEFSRWKREGYDNSSIVNTYIIIFGEKVFCIERFFVREIKSYMAIGAGQDFANAALYLGHSPRDAVKVACNLSCFVAEPIIEEVIRLQKATKTKK